MSYAKRKPFIENSNEVGDMWLYSNVEGLFRLHRENKTFDQQFIYYAGGKFAADISLCFHICNQQVFL